MDILSINTVHTASTLKVLSISYTEWRANMYHALNINNKWGVYKCLAWGTLHFIASADDESQAQKYASNLNRNIKK